MGERESSSKNYIDITCAIIIKEGKVFIARRAPGQALAGKYEFPRS